MMGEDTLTKKRKFYSLTENRHYYIDVPELHDQHWIGSSFGWLFIIDRELVPRLFNPLTREWYELPLLPKFEEDTLRKRFIKAILSLDPSQTCDFTVLVLYHTNFAKVAFWRPGESAWTCVPDRNHIVDAIFSRGNFYLAGGDNLCMISDLGSNPTVELVMPLFSSGTRYLVDFMGELLLVERHIKFLGDKHDRHCKWHMVTERFTVDKLNLQERSSSECNKIGDYAIFLGTRCSGYVVDSQLFPGCKRNSIYFTDLVLKLHPGVYGCDDLGIYDFTTDTIELYYPPEIFHPFSEPPTWLTPTINRLLN
ncbi:F-box protein SKIP23 [Rhynchospora pubera]|uniref:F-box protein SKIP23 n=1 Tax=Rhynchospora pubera TaxID=906938 RepID=A0AAV8CC34_9POAL|nr:F-box protein SKIP23 [Rhynchospora pubera]